MNDKVIAIILGRKGSKGVKDKNTMDILGKPAFSYSFTAAKTSKYVDKIFVTSDHEKILKTAINEGFSIIKRPKYLCNDEALFEDALVHAYNKIKRIIKSKPKYIVVLMCNVVTVDAELIDKGVELLNNNKTADSAVTVSIFNMYSPLRARKLSEEGFLEPFVPFEVFGNPLSLNCDRDSQGSVYFADMSHTVCRSDCIENIDEGLLPQKWMGQKIAPIFSEAGFDLDYEWQLPALKYWIKKYGK